MNKLKKIHLIFITIIVIFIIATIALIKTDTINKIFNKMYKQEETRLIQLDVTSVTEKTDSKVYSLTFIALNSDDKIKYIEYPEQNDKKDFSVEINEDGREKVAIDYEIGNNEELKPFKVTTLSGKTEEKEIGYRITYNYNGGEHETETVKNVIETKALIRTEPITRDGYAFYGWSENQNAIYPDYFENYKYDNSEKKEQVTLYAVWKKQTDNIQIATIENESLIGEISKLTESGDKTITVNDTNYDTDVIYINDNLILDGQTQVEGATLSNNVYTFGKTTDIGTASTNATKTVILKVTGNLTVNMGVTLTTVGSNYGGPKGLVLYCGGELLNNGIITMTARGAKATGQNVYLWQNEIENYEYVPATGATGGAAASSTSNNTAYNGKVGNNGTTRQTGGGGTGAMRTWKYRTTSSAGGTGTSYSGGSGSGAANSDGTYGGTATSGAGSSAGGAGGNGAVNSSNTSGYGQISMGGTGNPSGSYKNYRISPVNYVSRNGTGGLLIIYANSLYNNYQISADGVSSSTANRSNSNGRIDTGGASGGGSINIFFDSIQRKGIITANGGASIYGEGGNAGGAGGNGSVSLGNISSKMYTEYIEE